MARVPWSKPHFFSYFYTNGSPQMGFPSNHSYTSFNIMSKEEFLFFFPSDLLRLRHFSLRANNSVSRAIRISSVIFFFFPFFRPFLFSFSQSRISFLSPADGRRKFLPSCGGRLSAHLADYASLARSDVSSSPARCPSRPSSAQTENLIFSSITILVRYHLKGISRWKVIDSFV